VAAKLDRAKLHAKPHETIAFIHKAETAPGKLAAVAGEDQGGDEDT
jgi:hypothetical protein